MRLLLFFYVGGALATLAYLFQVGRSGLKRRSLQVVAAVGWPAYWLVVQGPRAAFVTMSQVISCVIFALFLVVLLPFVALERRGLI